MAEEKIFKHKFEKYMPSLKFPEIKGNALQIGVLSQKSGQFKDVSVILELAKQNKVKADKGDNCFDWTAKTIMSLGTADVMSVLAYISGRTKECKLIHKYPMNETPDKQKTTILELKFSEKGDLGWKVSQKKPGEQDFTHMQVYLNPGEVEAIDVLLRHILVKMYDAFDI